MFMRRTVLVLFTMFGLIISTTPDPKKEKLYKCLSETAKNYETLVDKAIKFVYTHRYRIALNLKFDLSNAKIDNLQTAVCKSISFDSGKIYNFLNYIRETKTNIMSSNKEEAYEIEARRVMSIWHKYNEQNLKEINFNTNICADGITDYCTIDEITKIAEKYNQIQLKMIDVIKNKTVNEKHIFDEFETYFKYILCFNILNYSYFDVKDLLSKLQKNDVKNSGLEKSDFESYSEKSLRAFGKSAILKIDILSFCKEHHLEFNFISNKTNSKTFKSFTNLKDDYYSFTENLVGKIEAENERNKIHEVETQQMTMEQPSSVKETDEKSTISEEEPYKKGEETIAASTTGAEKDYEKEKREIFFETLLRDNQGTKSPYYNTEHDYNKKHDYYTEREEKNDEKFSTYETQDNMKEQNFRSSMILNNMSSTENVEEEEMKLNRELLKIQQKELDEKAKLFGIQQKELEAKVELLGIERESLDLRLKLIKIQQNKRDEMRKFHGNEYNRSRFTEEN